MLKQNGASVTLVWPGGAPAGTGIFLDTGEFPNTYAKFFNRYNRGIPLILPGTEGQGQGVRAQLVGAGQGEGHVETSLSPCLMRAANDPQNKWQITKDDVSERRVTSDGVRAIDLTLYDFMALYGAEGVSEALSVYGSGSDKPATPKPGSATVNAELDTLRTALAGAKQEAQVLQGKLTDAVKIRDEAERGQLNVVAKMNSLLRELEARAKGMRKTAGEKGGGKYAVALRQAAEGLEKSIAAYREKTGA